MASTDAGTMASTTAAADVFRPQFIGLLFIVLSAVYFGVQWFSVNNTLPQDSSSISLLQIVKHLFIFVLS